MKMLDKMTKDHRIVFHQLSVFENGNRIGACNGRDVRLTNVIDFDVSPRSAGFFIKNDDLSRLALIGFDVPKSLNQPFVSNAGNVKQACRFSNFLTVNVKCDAGFSRERAAADKERDVIAFNRKFRRRQRSG